MQPYLSDFIESETRSFSSNEAVERLRIIESKKPVRVSTSAWDESQSPILRWLAGCTD